MKSILIVLLMLFLGGCEDLNTTCPKDANDSNPSDTNCSDINCIDYCSTINWSDINSSDTSCLLYCDCKPEPVIDCEKDEYEYCKIIIDDQNNSDFLCSDDLGFNPTCNFSDCYCNDIDVNHSKGIVGFGCECSIESQNQSLGLISFSGSISNLNSSAGSNSSTDSNPGSNPNKSYIMHTDIKTGLFWIGRNDNNYNITSSAWDGNWLNHYGGIDVPDSRNGYYPTAFTPGENSFYVALPYNDLGADGERKYGSDNYIPWASDNDDPYESICKNRWVEITANKKTAYAQWEDVGPYGYSTDINYVFGGEEPLNHNDTNGSGIAISPAVRDFLNLDANTTTVDWVFIEEANVPDGPWREIVTDRPSD